ncbi:MAG: hypothetical protein ACKOCQ_03180 [Candidatus Nitrosotenuis sp.]
MKNKIALLVLFMVFSFTINLAYAESVPNWVKDAAKYWLMAKSQILNS